MTFKDDMIEIARRRKDRDEAWAQFCDPYFPKIEPSPLTPIPEEKPRRTPYALHKKFILALFNGDVNSTQIRALVKWFRNNP